MGSADYISEMRVSFVWDNLTKHFCFDECMAMRVNPNQFTIIIPSEYDLPADGTTGAGYIHSDLFGEMRFSSIRRLRFARNQAILTVDTTPIPRSEESA